jgi:hypothetical protein
MSFFKKISVCLVLITLIPFSAAAESKASALTQTIDLSNKTVDAFGNMFQDLKNFLALTELKRTENEAALRYRTPPHVNETAQAGAKLHQGDFWIQALDQGLRKKLWTWNTLSDSKTASDSSYVERHLTQYCTESEKTHGLCQKAKRMVPVPYDMDAGSLFGLSELNTTDKQVSAYDYIRNLTNPTPIPALPADEMFKNKDKGDLTPEGMQNLMARYRQQVLVSLAQDSFLAMYSERVPYANQGTDEGLPPSIKNRSQLAVYEHEVSKRLGNTDWYKEMNQMPTEGLLREMANMMALQMSMDLKRYQQMQRIEAMQAAQLSFIAQSMAEVEIARQQAAGADS